LARRSFILFWEYKAISTPEFEARAWVWAGVVSLAGNRDSACVIIGLKLLPSDYVFGGI
jgi:hypothetical protein